MRWRTTAIALLFGSNACSGAEPSTHATARSVDRAPHVTTPIAGPDLVLAAEGRSRVVIYAPERLQDEPTVPDEPGQKRRPRVRLSPAELQAHKDAAQLALAVHDLVTYLGRLSGAEVRLAFGSPPTSPASNALPLLIGELAQQRFGAVAGHAPGKQSFRVVVQPAALGLFGESDVATGYAIYELLDRLGCRWFMPGTLGEEIPHQPQLVIAPADDTLTPSTLYRGIWYGDPDFKRRNRLGGIVLAAGHMLERWVTKDEREDHPEFLAQIGGKPSEKRLRWSNPGVAHAIAGSIEKQLDKRPADSMSLSPGDGMDFDDSSDRALDAGDWDPSVNAVSLTDRLMVLTNRVATELHPRYPELLFGVLAYASYTRPPVRESVHPNVVPVLAPITYCRVHPWSDDGCPGAKDARTIVEGWSRRAHQLAFRGYGYNLSEPAAPFPLLKKWSEDLPYLFAHKVAFFQPETLPNFETTLPGLWLGMRLSWNHSQTPQSVLTDLFDHFYGHASKQARAYWELIDAAWTDTPEFSGGGLGYARRFTPTLLSNARRAMDALKQACKTDVERQRVAMLDQSLTQLERYMKMDTDLKQARFANLLGDLRSWENEANRLADVYAPNAAFAKAAWAHGSVYAGYVRRFLEPLYSEADRIHREDELLTTASLCKAKYRLAPDVKVPVSGAPPSLGEADSATDFCSETWSTLGRYDYFGAMWYEAELDVAAVPPGKRAFVLLSKIDGAAQVWLNDSLLPPKDAAPGTSSAETHLGFLAYDVTGVLRSGGRNKLSVLVQRTRLAELGAGGILGPVFVYRER